MLQYAREHFIVMADLAHPWDYETNSAISSCFPDLHKECEKSSPS
jgi:hypothetical protein